jgi:uncharacterized BrkB/YihY/UPF0761 family membrane protein
MTLASSHSSFVSITDVLGDKSNAPFNTHAMGSTTPGSSSKRPLVGHGGVIPLRISTILSLSICFSLFFILAISFAFMGHDGDEPYFKKTLSNAAQNSPGVSHSVLFALQKFSSGPSGGARTLYRLFCSARALTSMWMSRLSQFDGVSLAAVTRTHWLTRQGFMVAMLVDYLQYL